MLTTALPQPGTTPAKGLSGIEAARRLSEYGPNDPAPSRQTSTVLALLLLFLNPFAIVLLIAAAFSAFLGQTADSLIIALVVLLGNAISFWQTYRSQHAIEHLRQSVISTASVLRDAIGKKYVSWPRRERPRSEC
jgi:P-type Mg2+ transporter